MTDFFKKLARLEALTGILLFIFATIAMLWANSGWSSFYFDFWETPVEITFGDFHLDKPLLIWINDGLMALFFFHIGLEIKREVLVGELSEPQLIFLPLFAALGGMLVPAGMFWLLNHGQPGMEGWGIPMATDIAFSLGVLLLLGKRVPVSFKVFLTAFAIVDDLGAVLIIAIFYSDEVVLSNLAWAGGIYALLWFMNTLTVRRPVFYALLGIGMWYFFLKGGIHPTVAGILAALAIPTNIKLRMNTFVEQTKSALNQFLDDKANSVEQFLSKQQLRAISRIEGNADKVQPPLQRLETQLDPYVTFLILPAFALANAGVNLSAEGAGISNLTWHITASLVVGKIIGITLFSWIGTQSGLARLPIGASWLQLIGLACLGGIGFTMSLFIGSLAFDDSALLNQAKLGILLGSVIAGLLGYGLLRYTLRRRKL